MDEFLEQTIKINNLKINVMTNAGVLKIGTAGKIKRKYSNIFGHYITLSGITTLGEPAVPMQAPIRKKNNIEPILNPQKPFQPWR